MLQLKSKKSEELNTKMTKKETQLVTAVTFAQLLFLENSFQKHKILTSLEAILERFVFKILKFRAPTMELLKLQSIVFIKVLVYLSICNLHYEFAKS